MRLDKFFDIVDGIVPDERGCKIWPYGKIADGYPSVRLDRRTHHGHRLELSRKLGRPIGDGLRALHTCDNPSCVAQDHLYEGTAKQNTEDMYRRGRQNRPRGADHHGYGPQQSPEIIQKIHELRVKGLSTRRIAAEVGVCQTVVSRRLRGL